MKAQLNSAILRQALYRFFGSMFLYPENGLIDDLRQYATELKDSKELWEDKPYSEKLDVLIRSLITSSPENRKDIIDDYNRLFHVKPKVPPYQSAYYNASGRAPGEIAAEISGIYGQSGLIVSPEHNELPDHIAIELEFMSFLCEKEGNAVQEKSDDVVFSLRSEQQYFVMNHLAMWFPVFTKKVLDETYDGLYRYLVESVFLFLRNELKYLEIKQ